jgi:hypothetical protein
VSNNGFKSAISFHNHSMTQLHALLLKLVMLPGVGGIVLRDIPDDGPLLRFIFCECFILCDAALLAYLRPRLMWGAGLCSDLGAHIDGFVATAAHTVVVQADPEAPVTGREADVITAAHTALEAAIRLVRPGKRISEVGAPQHALSSSLPLSHHVHGRRLPVSSHFSFENTPGQCDHQPPSMVTVLWNRSNCAAAQVAGPLQQVVEAYGVNLVEGVLSHQLKQFVIDGNKCILNKPTPEHRVEDGEFEENEVYAIDVVVSPTTVVQPRCFLFAFCVLSDKTAFSERLTPVFCSPTHVLTCFVPSGFCSLAATPGAVEWL